MFDHLRKNLKNSIFFTLRGVAQLVARDVWDVDAAGSNPVTPTKICALCTKKSVLFVRLGLIFCSLSPTCSLAKRPQFSAKRFLSAQDTGFVRFYKHFECFWEIPFLCLLRRKF